MTEQTTLKRLALRLADVYDGKRKIYIGIDTHEEAAAALLDELMELDEMMLAHQYRGPVISWKETIRAIINEGKSQGENGER